MQTLTLFLLKEGASASSVLDMRKDFRRCEVRDGEKIVGELFVMQSRPGRPAWLRFFKGAVVPLPMLATMSTGAVLLIERRGGRIFAATFGQGRHLLRPGTWVENFGLRVALNSIEPGKIRSLEHKRFDAIARLSRTQGTCDATAEQLGVDVERDVLRALTGTDRRLGSRVTGADALVIPAPGAVANLPAKLEDYAARWASDAYKRTGFAWVDHIAEMKDAKLVAELDDAVAAWVRNGRTDMVGLSVPELVDWQKIDGFVWKSGAPAAKEPRLSDFLQWVRDPRALSVATLKARRLVAVDDAGEAVSAWSVHRCLACELTIGPDDFVLTNGRWYRIARDFVREVNASVAKLEGRMPELLAYDDANEGAYNERVARGNPRMALVDKKMVHHGGGRSSIEFCDLFSDRGQMIHVKRYSGSSTLSHLFAQGSVSAHLWLTDAEYRKKVDEKLPRAFRIGGEVPDAREYEIVYAIVDGSKRSITEFMPFFSRLALRNAARQLAGYGYRVAATIVRDETLAARAPVPARTENARRWPRDAA